MDFDYWNGPAGHKWAATHGPLDEILEPFGRAVVDAAEIPPEGVVVDVGCGCGATTLMVAHRHPQAWAVGVDISAPMLEVARRRSTTAERVRFEHADAATTRPCPEPVDRLISRFGIMFFSDPASAFANLRNWLTDDGRLAAVVWGPLDDNPWIKDPLQIVERHTGAPSMGVDGPGPFSLADPVDVERTLRRSGFARIEQDWLDIPMRIGGSLEDLVDFFTQRGPIAKTLEEVDEATRAAIVGDIRRLAHRHHDGSGAALPARARIIQAHAS